MRKRLRPISSVYLFLFFHENISPFMLFYFLYVNILPLLHYLLLLLRLIYLHWDGLLELQDLVFLLELHKQTVAFFIHLLPLLPLPPLLLHSCFNRLLSFLFHSLLVLLSFFPNLLLFLL